MNISTSGAPSSLTLPSSWVLSVIVPILPGQPPVGLLVPVDPHPVDVGHGGTLDVHVVVADSHFDWLTTQETELAMFFLSPGISLLGRDCPPPHLVQFSSLVIDIRRIISIDKIS